MAVEGAALVTGGARRLGRAMALELARRGHDVAVHYGGSSDAAAETAGDIEAKGRRAVTVQADLLDEGAVQALVPEAAARLGGPVHVLVNNASIFEDETYQTATRQSWDRHMESNLRAPFALTQGLAAQVPDPVKDDNGEPVAQGLVVNMIDQRVLKPTPAFMTYSLAKAGLWALTRTSAQALAPRIRVNAIGPGPTMQGARQSAEHFARQRAATSGWIRCATISRNASPPPVASPAAGCVPASTRRVRTAAPAPARTSASQSVATCCTPVGTTCPSTQTTPSSGHARSAADDGAQVMGEYLTEESRDVVGKAELNAFFDDVDQLREAVDRLAARLDRLQPDGDA